MHEVDNDTAFQGIAACDRVGAVRRLLGPFAHAHGNEDEDGSRG